MSTKNTLVTQVVENQSLSAAFTSPPTVIRYLDNCSYQINVTTTDSTGTFQVEASNDYYVNEGNNSVIMDKGNWVPLTLTGASNAGIPTVNANNTVITISLNQVPFYALRVSYTSNTPGTGTCDIFVTDKRLN